MVKITKVTNGLMFDTTGLPGSGDDYAKKAYFPLSTISNISLYNNKVIGFDAIGDNWDMNLTGENAAYPVSHIEGVAVTSIEDLFNKLIALI